MTIKIYNTLSKKKEVFIPQKENHVSFYVCGVTVYDYCHIGHARAYVAFDTIRRYLEYVGYNVNYIQNFTDIDDKIIDRANELGIPFEELTETYINAYFKDMDTLNIKRASQYPQATHYIPQIIALIQSLINKQHAYQVDNDIYFSVKTTKDYGKLSKKVIEDLEAGIRVGISDKKENPLDFALWKSSKPGEPSWDSPWGKGRPGWHIECSAMSMDTLGKTIDIHGGGADLIFPHHENEICQSECATGHEFVKYWIHNGFVNIKNEKMSKSKRNFLTINDILKSYSGEEVRFFLQKIHYRHPLNFSYEGLDEAKRALSKLYNTLENIENQNEISNENQDSFEVLEKKFNNALQDDFNYTEGIGILFEMSKLINSSKSGSHLLKKLGNVIGLFLNIEQKEESLDQEIQNLIDERTAAKNSKDYETADHIRKTLFDNFRITLEDTPNGVKWKRNS